MTLETQDDHAMTAARAVERLRLAEARLAARTPARQCV